MHPCSSDSLHEPRGYSGPTGAGRAAGVAGHQPRDERAAASAANVPPSGVDRSATAQKQLQMSAPLPQMSAHQEYLSAHQAQLSAELELFGDVQQHNSVAQEQNSVTQEQSNAVQEQSNATLE
jgi:hypothetical protein